MKYLMALLGLLSFFTAADTLSVDDIKQLEEFKSGASISEDTNFIEVQTSFIEPKVKCLDEEKCIYGYDLFSKSPTTFALSSDVPVPPDYILGPGDEVKLDYYGNESISKSVFIDRSGIINLPLLGPITIAGKTLEDALKIIEKRISAELIGTSVYVSLGQLRSINVFLLGEAYNPGTYTVSALSSLTNILFATGGVSKIGSLRNIQVKRQNNLIANYDFYKTIFEGNTSQDLKLQDGDTIFIPLIKKRALVDGAVLRPGFYEIRDNETLSDLIELAGKKSQQVSNFQFNTYNADLERRVSKISLLRDEDNSLAKDGDVITLIDNSASIISTVELRGEFKYPGIYSIGANDTIYDLIAKAGGLTEQAYTEGSIFTRKSIARIEKESYEKNADNLERALVNSASLGNILEGSAYLAITELIQKLRTFQPVGRQVVEADPYLLKIDPKLNFTLQNGDVLIVPKRTESVSVVGEVLNPISHRYNEELAIEDYLRLSGGLTEGADKNQIFIVSPNGQAELYKNKLFRDNLSSTLLPGSTIVVARNTQPFDWLKLTTVLTPILSDLAVSAAAIATISDNN